MRARLSLLLIAIFIAASVGYKLTFHFQEKLRFALLPFIRDYDLGWLMDVMIGMELLFVLLLLFRASRMLTLYGLAIYFSIHLAVLAYQKFIAVCSECMYHSNFVGEPINISMLLFFSAIAGVLLLFRQIETSK